MADTDNNLLDPEVPDETVASDDTEITQEFTRPDLTTILVAEIKELAAIGMALNQKISSAKTNPKRDLYRKKLVKNSKKAAEIILYLEQVQVNKAIKEKREQQKFIDIRNNDDGESSDAESVDGGRVSTEGEEA